MDLFGILVLIACVIPVVALIWYVIKNPDDMSL